MEDKLLLKRIKKNDEKAFEELFRRYFVSLSEYANFYTHDLNQAEDIVQDVFFKIWQLRKKLDINTSFKSYLFRAVHNTCIKYLKHLEVAQKHSKAQKIKLEEAKVMNRLFFEDGLTRLFQSDINEIVNGSLSRLPDKTREIFLMSREENLKNSEIAIKIKLTEKTVEYHMSRALGLLREDLKDYLPVFIMVLFLLL